MIVSTNSILLIAIYDYIYMLSIMLFIISIMSIIIMTCFSAVSSVSSAMFCSIKRFALFCRSSCFSASSRWTLMMMITMRIRLMTTTTMVMTMRVVLPWWSWWSQWGNDGELDDNNNNMVMMARALAGKQSRLMSTCVISSWSRFLNSWLSSLIPVS